MSSKNPFADLFQQFSTDAFAQPDWNGALTTFRSNMQAFTDAAQTASEGSQALARRQTEIAQRQAEELSNFLKNSMEASKSPEKSISQATKFANSAIQSSVSDTKELLGLAGKTQTEALELISKRMADAVNELGDAAATANKAATSATKKASQAA